MIPQHFPLYIRERNENRVWLVVGWVPDKVSGLPRQPVVLLADEDTQEPRLLETTTPFRVLGSSPR